MTSSKETTKQPIWVYMTASHKREARILVHALLKEKLIACANFKEQWVSVYQWEGEIVENRETVIIAKSQRHKFETIETRVKEILSYDCPCIIAMPIIAGHAPYLEWLDQTLSS